MSRNTVAKILLTATLAITGCGSPKPVSIVGTWTGGTDDAQTVELTFESDGKISITVDDDIGYGTYRVDLSTKPPQLDIDWGDQDGKLETIFSFVDENQLQIEDSEPGDPRPKMFTEDAVILTRKK